MHYLIDDKILFFPQENLLRAVDAKQSDCSLPRPATLLLLALIRCPGTLISRDALMEEAWDAHGFRASGHNLNTYLSVLRHALNELGADSELIKTLPRQGLIMRDVVVPVVDTDKVEATENEQPEPTVAPQPGQLQTLSAPRVFSRNFIAWSLLLLAAALVLPWFFHGAGVPEMPERKIWLAGKVKNCPVYALRPVSADEKAAMLLDVAQLDKNQRCETGRYHALVDVKERGNQFLSSVTFCHTHENDYSACSTYYQEGKPWQQ